MAESRVAAVVVTYDALPWIEQCLDSLRGVETIVVDNGSSDGTVALVRERYPAVRIIESGPTAAVIASQYYGRMFKIRDIFCFDMGGTTAKSCLIQKGVAGVVPTFEVGRVQRFMKGSGLTIQVPVVPQSLATARVLSSGASRAFPTPVLTGSGSKGLISGRRRPPPGSCLPSVWLAGLRQSTGRSRLGGG